MNILTCFPTSRGHADGEIEAVFAKYDVDGDRVLTEIERKRMQEDLENQKVRVPAPYAGPLTLLALGSVSTYYPWEGGGSS